MLLEFRTINHKSLRNEQVLSCVASGRLAEDWRTRKSNDETILPALAVYGSNASGKSNLVSAANFMFDAVISSYRVWEPDLGVPRSPYAWADRSTASTYEAEFIVDDCKYRYGFSVNDSEITDEWLDAFPERSKQTWFVREGKKFTFGKSLKDQSVRGQLELMQKITGDNSLFLSVAIQNRHKKLLPIHSWFRSAQVHALVARRRTRITVSEQVRLRSLLTKKEEQRTEAETKLLRGFTKLLQVSDFGVVDVKHDHLYQDDAAIPSFFLKHKVEDSTMDPWLPLSSESRGTQVLFELGLPILIALEQGSLIFIDELEASLHPLLAMSIVELFNSPKTNPNNAQLIFTTHDSNLLGNTLGDPIVRRDQVYLVEKNKLGESEIYPLTDYKPRKAENLERGYLQGRYGAIPFLGRFSELGAAGNG